MNRVQRLQLRQSELREQVGAILDTAAEERSDEQRESLRTLTAEARSLEGDLQAALIAEPEPATTETETREDGDAESREVRELRSRFSIGRLLGSMLRDRVVTGPEAEYAAARKMAAGQVPIDVWQREERAVTPSGDAAPGVSQAPIVPAIFDRSVAPYLGVEMPSAGTGDQAYPVLSTSLQADPKARGASAPEKAGAFTVATAEPRRVTGAFRIRVEDTARLAGLEESLRSNLSMVLSDQVDNQLVNGSAAAGGEDGKVRGLLATLADPAAAIQEAANKKARWEDLNAGMVAFMDGLMSVDLSTIRGLVGTETYRLMASVFRSATTDDSFATYWSRVAGGVRASRRIGAVAANVQAAIIRRGNPMGDRVAVMPVWDSMTIRDVYSGAGEGEIVVTAYILVGDVVLLRPDAFAQASFRVTDG